MGYFTEDFLSFFVELEQSNHKQWFDANRRRYEQSVKRPFLDFVAEMLRRIQALDPSLAIDPRDCVLRINRDIRFSKDKSPYNLYCTAFLSPAGRKDKSQPGLFFRLGAREAGMLAGCYRPSTEQLERIRHAIEADPEGFRRLLGQEPLRRLFGELQGQRLKRIPPRWREAFAQEERIANKQLYLLAERDAAWILTDRLADELLEYWHAARPLNSFLSRAMHGGTDGV